MKIVVRFKDPDALDNVLLNAVNESLLETLDADERDEIRESRMCKLRDQLTKSWVLWGEYLKVEFDLTNGTATVLPVGN